MMGRATLRLAILVACTLPLVACYGSAVGRADHRTLVTPRMRNHAVVMKDWSKRKTLADVAGGAGDKGAAAVGLEGSIPVRFEQGNETLTTMAQVGQPLSAVAAQAGQAIRYKCRKGECGTCEVRVDGQWVRTCVTTIPYMAPGTEYKVHVRPSMAKVKKSSRFFSFRSFIAGFRNNLLGMVGFVRDGRKSGDAFKHRIDSEKELMERVAAKKAAKLLSEQGMPVNARAANEIGNRE